MSGQKQQWRRSSALQIGRSVLRAILQSVWISRGGDSALVSSMRSISCRWLLRLKTSMDSERADRFPLFSETDPFQLSALSSALAQSSLRTLSALRTRRAMDSSSMQARKSSSLASSSSSVELSIAIFSSAHRASPAGASASRSTLGRASTLAVSARSSSSISLEFSTTSLMRVGMVCVARLYRSPDPLRRRLFSAQICSGVSVWARCRQRRAVRRRRWSLAGSMRLAISQEEVRRVSCARSSAASLAAASPSRPRRGEQPRSSPRRRFRIKAIPFQYFELIVEVLKYYYRISPFICLPHKIAQLSFPPNAAPSALAFLLYLFFSQCL